MTGSIIEEDIRTDDGHELYLVRPSGVPPGPGIIYLHWFDATPTANRTQFLDEAREMATLGVVSALPQLSFPWHEPPRNAEDDLSRIGDEISFLREVRARLSSVDGVDASRLGIVGHDFGAMYGILLAADSGTTCSVFIAPTPRWADWFLRFWPISTDRYDYMRAMGPVDPIAVAPSLTGPIMFQFAKNDFYIATMTSTELHAAAPEPTNVVEYETDHAMLSDSARADRYVFIRRELGL